MTNLITNHQQGSAGDLMIPRKQIERSVNRVFELAAELAANVKPRTNLDKAMTAMSLFVGLPKGAAYADDFAVVEHCVRFNVIDRDVFELGLVAAGFIRN